MLSRALVTDGGSASDRLSGRRSRILEQLRVDLRHHPAIETVAFRHSRDGTDTKLVGEFDTDILVRGVVEADEAKLVINWWPQPSGMQDQFKFHYVESSGYDCGWHRQPHPEETDIPFDHFQQRTTPENDSQYQGVDFLEDSAIGLFWEITGARLPNILRARWTP